MANPGRIDMELIEVQTGFILAKTSSSGSRTSIIAADMRRSKRLQMDGSRHCRLW